MIYLKLSIMPMLFFLGSIGTAIAVKIIMMKGVKNDKAREMEKEIRKARNTIAA